MGESQKRGSIQLTEYFPIFRVVGGDLAPSLRFIEESSEY